MEGQNAEATGTARQQRAALLVASHLLDHVGITAVVRVVAAVVEPPSLRAVVVQCRRGGPRGALGGGRRPRQASADADRARWRRRRRRRAGRRQQPVPCHAAAAGIHGPRAFARGRELWSADGTELGRRCAHAAQEEGRVDQLMGRTGSLRRGGGEEERVAATGSDDDGDDDERSRRLLVTTIHVRAPANKNARAHFTPGR